MLPEVVVLTEPERSVQRLRTIFPVFVVFFAWIGLKLAKEKLNCLNSQKIQIGES